MSIEERLREAFSIARGGHVDTQGLWRKVEQRVVARNRRRPVVVLAGATAALGLFAVVFLWTVHEFHGTVPPPRRTARPVVVAGVQWRGDPVVGWKVFPQLVNRTDRPLGVALTCTLRDGQGRRSLPGTGVLNLLRPHATTDDYFVFVRSFREEPVTGRCIATAIPPTFPSPLPDLPPHFVPTRIAFWNGRQGVASGHLEARPCADRCRAAVAVTNDGGRTWRVSLAMAGNFDSIETLGTLEAWVRLETPQARSVVFFHSTDGGHSWTRVKASNPVQNTQFVTSTRGFGTSYGDLSYTGDLMATSDGGRTWRPVGNPCHQGKLIRSIWFLTPSHGWIWCISGRGTADSTFKELLTTSDGAASWSVVRATGLQLNGEPEEVQFLDASQGWSWNGLGFPERTDDAGRSWTIAPVPGFSVLDGDATGWAVSRMVVFALNYRGGRVWLSRSTDGGQTWSVVRRWHDAF